MPTTSTSQKRCLYGCFPENSVLPAHRSGHRYCLAMSVDVCTYRDRLAVYVKPSSEMTP